jgi:hypothetical protein
MVGLIVMTLAANMHREVMAIAKKDRLAVRNRRLLGLARNDVCYSGFGGGLLTVAALSDVSKIAIHPAPPNCDPRMRLVTSIAVISKESPG